MSGNGNWVYMESQATANGLQTKAGTASVWSQANDPTTPVVAAAGAGDVGLLTDKEICTQGTGPLDTLIE